MRVLCAALGVVASALNVERRQFVQLSATAPLLWKTRPSLATANEEVQVLAAADGAEVILIGTAHISQESARVVRETIGAAEPSLVAVELDQQRLFRETRRKLGLGGLAMEFFLKTVYDSLEKTGVETGNEFLAAFESAARLGVPVLLADRDIDVTLKHTFDAARKTDLEPLLEQIDPDSVVDADVLAAVEKNKNRAAVKTFLADFQRLAPDLYAAVVAERDQTMAENLLAALASPAAPDRVLLVCGIAHEDGVAARLRARGFRDVPAWRRRRRSVAPVLQTSGYAEAFSLLTAAPVTRGLELRSKVKGVPPPSSGELTLLVPKSA